MMKLFISDNLSAYSSDTVFKICLALESGDFREENVESFDSYDSMFDALNIALQDGEHIIVAAETAEYNAFKAALISLFSLEEFSSSAIAETIAKNTTGSLSDIDMAGHSLMPQGAMPLLSDDGLYSGFSIQLFSGRLTCVPLDFSRIDTIINVISQQIIAKSEALTQAGIESEIPMPDFDLIPSVSQMVNSLYNKEKSIALCTGEATMWIYNLYDKIDYLTDCVRFMDIPDDEEQEYESESAKVIARAREAMLSSGTDFGGAISEIYSEENEEGTTVYFAFAALVDSQTAKAKKINISDPDNLSIMLPHAVTLLSDMVEKRLIAKKPAADNQEPSDKKEPIVVTPKMLGILALLVVALIVPIVLVFNMIGGDEPTTLPTIQTTLPTQGTTADPFAGTTQPSTITNTEKPAADVSATQTTAPQPSTSGIFTFYCFGYGHGVGMSQTGADYLAKQGWTWAEILSHYYYDANSKIVNGDSYPSKITYAGAEYDTREYLAKVLEAEMGASFHTEALKAQCVAVYSFAKYYSFNLQKDAHAFSAATPSPIIYGVVDDVMNNGYYIACGDSVALTPFHSMSAGVTTSYYNVWGKNTETHVSYLAGGRQSPGDYLDDEYKSVYTITSDDLKKLIEENDELKVDLSGDPSTWLTILTHDQAIREDVGYVSTINVGGMVVTGNDFRVKVMQGRIRSHCFALQYTPV